jgi:uncharacterized protein (DUF305 family)
MRTALMLTIVPVLVLAGCGSDENPDAKAQGGSEAASTTLAGQGASGSAPARGADLDRAFINGMAAHHQGGIDMAKVEIDNGADARVKAFAERIVTTQQRDISELTEMARKTYQFTPDRQHEGPMGSLMGVPVTTDMAAMRKEVEAARGVDLDHKFLMIMRVHHAAAIPMADEEARFGADQTLRELAVLMIGTQSREIGEMQDMLAN